MNRMKLSWLNVLRNSLLVSLAFISYAAQAQGGGLGKIKTGFEAFRTEILTIVPIAAIIALISMGIAYAMNFVEKTTFFRWAIGLVIAGSATQITNMLFT